MSAAARIGRGVGRVSDQVMAKASGAWLWTADDRKVLDFACGIGVTNTGHCHPKVVAAIQQQAGTMMHAQVACGYHQPMLDLVDRLKPHLPDGPKAPNDHLFFATTGAEAVENSLKAARVYTRKPNVIVFQGGYHGRSFGTMPLTTSKAVYRADFGPFMGGVHVAPFPYRSSFPSAHPAADEASYVEQALDQLELVLKQQSTPSETCAMLIEPQLGEGGYVPAPLGFLREVQKMCNDNDILLIADEVQTGFGRTGKFFAIDGHYDVKPDIQIMAKGLASGMPLSAIAFSKEISDAQVPGSFGGTYAGNVVACAAANATIDVMVEENMVENASAMGWRLKNGLRKLQHSGKYPIKSVRGLGLMIGMEFDGGATGAANKVATAALSHDLLLLTTSVYECIRFIPPLNISEEEVDIGLERVEAALDAAFC